MKRNSLLIFTLFCCLALYSEHIKIMTWNTENTFDAVDEPGKSDTVVDAAHYNDKLNLLAGILKKYQPNIAGLCEIENIETLKDLAQRTGYQYYYLIEGNDPRGIDVAVLADREMQYTSHKNQPTPYPGNPRYKFSRDCTEGIFHSDRGNSYHFLTTHLKSGYQDDGNSEMKREAQVKGILDIVNAIYTSEGNREPLVIINGDFNSDRHTSPINIIEKAGFVIMNYRESPDDLYTYLYKKQKETLDYIIINKHLFDMTKNKTIYSVNDPSIRKISDHFPVIMEFDEKQ